MIADVLNQANTVDWVMTYIVVISVILLFGITFAMIYFVFKYNRKKGHKPVDIHGNIILETIWIVIPTILVLTMFYFGYEGYKQGRYIPEDAYYVSVKAKMWDWDFIYDNGKQTDTLYVPNNRTIVLEMESFDVNHSLFIPTYRVKKDVIAGKTNYLVFTPDIEGTFDITCAEYCGLEHSDMYTSVVVLSPENFENWLKEGVETPEVKSIEVEKTE